MSAWTNAYWPRSGDRGSAIVDEQLAPHEVAKPRLELPLGGAAHGRQAAQA